jgi:hypothetical protein
MRPGTETFGLSKEECDKWVAFWAEVAATITEAEKPASGRELAPIPRMLIR